MRVCLYGTAQTVPDNRPGSFSDALFQTLGLAAPESDLLQCRVRVIANDVVVSAKDWHEVAHHVLPPGVVENPDQWPFFAWSDTPLGVVRTHDKKGYLFFGSDGGNHPFDGHLTSRAGSITTSTGTLDHPLGLPTGDPNPPPSEFLLPKSHNLPATMDYVGGGPVYRVPEGEPGREICSSFITRNGPPTRSGPGWALRSQRMRDQRGKTSD